MAQRVGDFVRLTAINGTPYIVRVADISSVAERQLPGGWVTVVAVGEREQYVMETIDEILTAIVVEKVTPAD